MDVNAIATTEAASKIRNRARAAQHKLIARAARENGFWTTYLFMRAYARIDQFAYNVFVRECDLAVAERRVVERLGLHA